MKKHTKKVIFLCLALLAGIVFAYYSRPERFEWGDISSIDLTYYFDCRESNLMVMYGFAVRWSNPGIETGIEPAQYFSAGISIRPFGRINDEYVVRVPSQRISPEELEPLRRILEEHNTEAWYGFVGSAFPDELNFVYGLNVNLVTGSRFSATGSREIPENFDVVFPLLVDVFMDMAKRYADDTADFDRVPCIFEIAPFMFENP